MKVLENTPEKLSVSFREPLWLSLPFSSAFLFVGLVFTLFGLSMRSEASIETFSGAWLIPSGLGLLLMLGGFLSFQATTQTVTFAFCKADDSVLWEHQDLFGKVTHAISFPLHLVSGTTVRYIRGTTSDESAPRFAVRLILSPLHLRINFRTFGNEKYARDIAKWLAHFLDVPHFQPPKNAAPKPRKSTIDLPTSQRKYEGWKGVEQQVEDLQAYLNENPDDADSHRALGIILHRQSNRKLKDAIAHFELAEKLYQGRDDDDNVALTQLLKEFVSLGYRGYLRK